MPSNPILSATAQLTSADGHSFDVFEAVQKTGKPKAGLIVVQEVFGLTDYIRNVSEQLAHVGYQVIAPALFDRVQPEAIFPYDEDGLKKGMEIYAQLDQKKALEDIEACINALRHENPERPIGIIGFCLGGSLAWKAAQSLKVDASVAWYGGEIAQNTSPEPRCPVQLHFGDNDAYVSEADLDMILDAYPDIPLYVYKNAEHGFGCTDRASFNAEASELAWERTLAFFSEKLEAH
ncbi:dienelactone hydrolase family protein [Aristophania vespae]|uniref:Dienelactone hydrolase family protein n=1 Tax=Aristophania vespae TaxID=2697033 RepID=A0A6P1ND34_9PROT|nr:dienelactone hydrolase family protein [Aristophania vespae]QHI95393.1 dienelactone hydrolase family protein [Aristophania vespae]